MALNTESVKDVADALKNSGQTIAVAESTTGGLISARLLSVQGASAYFLGGVVMYSRQSRKVFLRASAEKLQGVKPLSEDMAKFFAVEVKNRLGATWGVAELGIAGPTGAVYGFAAGSSVIAVAGPAEGAVTVNTGHNDREKNMVEFTDAACRLLQHVLAGK